MDRQKKVKEFIRKVNKINKRKLVDPYTELDFIDVFLLNKCKFKAHKNMEIENFSINEEGKIIYTIIWDIGYSENGSSPYEKQECVLESFKELLVGGEIEPPDIHEALEYLEILLNKN